MANNRLDVEHVDHEERLRRLLERTERGQSQHPRPVAGTSTDPSRPSFDFGVRETHAVEPPTHLLDRLHQFLPQMEAANADLLQRAQLHPESVDIEHLDANHEGSYIEMDLGLGVFDMRRPASDHSDSESNTDSESGDGTSDASSSATDGVDSEVEDAYGTLIGNFLNSAPSTQRPMRPLPKRAHPIIQVIGDPSPSDDSVHENENSNPS